ncbi:hypothetical protein IT408_03905 [Candidatus Uhrbacteria bacterium]|nr:hypothetical protein [Candidatus Uhrbacteria bacterium]
MPKKSEAWHREDIAAEWKELQEARGFISRWSEYSDVAYTYTRALWSGHASIQNPLGFWMCYWGLLYMFPKYTLRWLFYRRVGKKLNARVSLTEVRNPHKTEKLYHIAEKYGLDAAKFEVICREQLRYWPLLK